MNIRSKETELLVKLLDEFKDGPDDLNSLVRALRQKGHCKNLATTYNYANRILVIKRIFMAKDAENHSLTHPTLRRTAKEAGEAVQEIDRQGLPILYEINAVIDDPRLAISQKRQSCESLVQVLLDRLAKRLHEQKDPERIRAQSDTDKRYEKLEKHGLL